MFRLAEIRNPNTHRRPSNERSRRRRGPQPLTVTVQQIPQFGGFQVGDAYIRFFGRSIQDPSD